jgi:16S rRNA (guanine966-N2)-methyltransferase
MELLAPYLDGARIVDLFAGTGALGLEALSRGARSADFVENNSAAIHSLKANVAALRARDRSRIFDRDAIPFTERLGPDSYDVAMADPPYGSRKLDRIVRCWLDRPFCAVLALEHDASHELPRGALTRRLESSAVSLLRAPRAARPT